MPVYDHFEGYSIANGEFKSCSLNYPFGRPTTICVEYHFMSEKGVPDFGPAVPMLERKYGIVVAK